ncbi:MAG TPA: 2Fe-2S iron-sulfur cluster-binding protein [Acidobacteriaceae bacterium]|nr:2Fe-2S iron-sulfur cluster-binding protein [Acidobacteriaceae bacterium]
MVDAVAGECLIDALNRADKILPQVCYHPHLGPIQTCDTCMVEISGGRRAARGPAKAAVTVSAAAPAQLGRHSLRT